MSTPHEKGLALEHKIFQLLKTKGYDVVHNAHLKGKSGVEHQIDVYAEYQCPLHRSKLVVETKSYESPVDKDRIMKLIQTVNDLGADRGIIITTSYFTPDATKTAEGYSVDLWDRDTLVKLLGEIEIESVAKGLPEKVTTSQTILLPSLMAEDAKGIIQDILNQRAKGGFLGRGKIVERLEKFSLIYYPYHEVELEADFWETEKTGLLSKRTVKKTVNTKVNIDAVTGDLVNIDQNGISYDFGFMRNLSEDEINVLRSFRIFKIADLTSLGFTESKGKKIANSLLGKGLVQSFKPKQGPMNYTAKVQFPSDPRVLDSISRLYQNNMISEDVKDKLSVKVEASSIITAFESYWINARTGKISTIYYPYYIYSVIGEDGSRRIEFLDGKTGKLNESLSRLEK